MARSLFGHLARLHDPERYHATRRDVLKATLAMSAGLLLSSRFASAQPSPSKSPKRVIVIGAGFAGLACAHELFTAGIDVKVIEARSRVGGRVLTFTDFVSGKTVEGGGELIGDNHPTWASFRDKFNLSFLPVTEAEDKAIPIAMNGKLLSNDDAKKLYDDMDPILAKLTEDAKDILSDEPWNSPDSVKWDTMSTARKLASIEGDKLTLHAVGAQLTNNNSVSTENQSYLANLTQIKGGGLENYWLISETQRCAGGNQKLAFALLEAITPDRVQLNTTVTRIRVTDKGVHVTLSTGTILEADEVVLAVPPSVWKDISFEPGLPTELAPQMGNATKFLAHVKSRFWDTSNLSPDAFTDSAVGMTWDATDAQPYKEGDPACMVGFSGGPAARQLSLMKDAAKPTIIDAMEKLYPGFKDQLVDSRYMNWPQDPLTKAGYAFAAPGEITKQGPILRKGLSRLHFAGEHCCYQFVGYMEGALHSGVQVGQKIAART